MPNINTVTVAGRLARDPETRFLQDGTCVAEFSIANDQSYKNQAGERVDQAFFFGVLCWKATAEYVSTNLAKGRPVLIEGQLTQETWEDKESGKKREKTKIRAARVHILDWPTTGGEQHERTETTKSTGEPVRRSEPIPEDDIPF